MTTISRSDVEHLANLSSLELRNDEIDGLRADIENILAHVETLSELDTEGVEPSYQVTGLKNVYRDDVVNPGVVSGEELVSMASESVQNQIKVPKVL